MNKLKKITEPNLIYGIIIGIVFSILASFLLTTQAFNYGFLGLLIIAVAFLAGIILGSLSLQYYRNNLQRGAQHILPELGDLAAKIGWNYTHPDAQSENNFIEQTSLLKQKLSELADWFAAIYMRITAFGALFTILGTMISFAVFWATFLQVNKLEEQISASKTASKIDIALSVSNNYQILLNALINDLSSRHEPLSEDMYQRIESTLHQLKPYYGIDIKTSELAKERNSPEQAFLLQYLSARNFTFPSDKIQLMHLKAQNMEIRYADFADANFYASDLAKGYFYKTVFNNSNMAYTILDNAKLHASELQKVDFSHAKLRGTEFNDSDLTGAKFEQADLSGANLNNIDGWKKIESLKGANIKEVKNAPKGFVEWALKQGAVQ